MRMLAAVLALSVVAAGSSAFGAQVLGVDFNSDSVTPGTFSPTQSGFQGVNVENGLGVSAISDSFTTDPSTTSGTTTVAISGVQIRSRDRVSSPTNSGSLTLADLYRDFALNDAADMTISVSGLKASTTYNLRFYVYDDLIATGSVVSTDQFTNTTGGAQPSPTVGSVSYGGSGAVTADNQYSIAFNATSDATGAITFDELNTTPASNQTLAILNGIVISTVPEPASLALLGLGGMMFLRRRRG